ncbi:MAG: hypothetical protein PHP62_01335 [Candidatus Moranbacteria bacterium]|nr:hypothetical protein [Candidatus Moranbacteria bacterium]
MSINKLKLHIKEIVFSDLVLKKSVVAIYGIGSIAKGKKDYHDIDLNIFINKNSFFIIKAIARLQKRLFLATEKDVDVNIVDHNSISNNILNSDAFTHKNRHSLFLYELTQVKCLLYGEDILKIFAVNYSDLIIETFKLVLTLVHRLNKEFLTKNNKDTDVHALKYAKYACEFALIFRGIKNPYLNMTAKKFLYYYPELSSHFEILNKIWSDSRSCNKKTISACYNLIVELGENMKNRLLFLIKSRGHDKEIVISSLPEKNKNALFVFSTKEELNLFFDTYDKTPAYKKIRA